jgi:hypothetical protein
VLIAIDYVADVWIPVGAALLGALLVVVPLYLAARRERSRAKASAEFRVDQFDYAVNWMTGHLGHPTGVPKGVSDISAEYCSDLRRALGEQYAEQLKDFLVIPEGQGGEINDPQKLLHLTLALVETRLREGSVSPQDLLTAKGLSAYVNLVLGLHQESRAEYASMLKSFKDSDHDKVEGFFAIKSLIEASPTCIKVEVANAASLDAAEVE